jgi:hypothetical protein
MAEDGAAYTFDLALGIAGEVTVNISAGVAHDAAGNPNNAAAEFARTYSPADTIAPTVTILSDGTEPTSESSFPVTVQFSEPVSGFEASDISVTNGIVTNYTAVNGFTYTFNVAPTAPGEVTVTIGTGVSQDAAANPNTAAEFSRLYTGPTSSKPTVTINQAAGQADPTDQGTVNFTVVFNKPVNGFTNAVVTLSGTAGANTVVVTEVAPNNGTTYSVAASGMKRAGTVIATIAADIATDGAGNGNQPSTSTDNTVTFAPGDSGFVLALPLIQHQ